MVAEEFYKVQLGSKIEAIRTKTNEEGEMRIALRLRLSMNSSGFKEGRAFGRGNSMSKVTEIWWDLRGVKSVQPGSRESSLGRGHLKLVLEGEPSSGGRTRQRGPTRMWAQVYREPDKLEGRKRGCRPRQFEGSWDKAAVTESKRQVRP